MLNIVHYPHPALTTKCEEVTIFNDDLKTITNEMLGTMKRHHGIGLAANQVNINKYLFVMSIDNTDYIFINPKIVDISNSLIDYTEGCLSFPNISQKTRRAEFIKLSWQDIDGQFHEQEFFSLSAICIQHEIEHLNGKTFLDLLSPLKKKFATKKYLKMNKDN